MNADDMKRAMRQVEAGVDRAERERKDPLLLLERVEARWNSILRELESRPGYKWGAEVPRGWSDFTVPVYLGFARRAIEAGDFATAATEMFYLGQALMRVEQPIADSVAQRQRKARAETAQQDRRERHLDDAALAWLRLRAKNDMKAWTLQDVASESGLPPRRLKTLGGWPNIRRRAAELRKPGR